MSTCPSEETLARLGDDSPDRAEWSEVEEHVQNCKQCARSLEKLLARETNPETVSMSLPADGSLPHIPGFQIEAEIGRGGMGVVYRARQPELARTVALKIVPSGLLTGSRERKRWLLEARCVTQVRHPNIVQIYHAGEAEGWLYLVLEFVPGGSLRERLKGPVPPRAAAELLRPIAAAMTAVHAADLLHLDLKPSNILLDSAAEAAWHEACPKVADFGIARSLADRDTSATSLAGPWGTPSYMAPEQTTAARAGIGAAADIHALGAILYELLTGRPPFQAASTLETLDHVRAQNPVPPRRLNPKIPRDLETIALKCLEKTPGRRYTSTHALADDLDCFLEGLPIKARAVPPVEHAWRWCRRQPLIAALAATLLLTLISSFLGTIALWRRSEANYLVATRSVDELLKILKESVDRTIHHPMTDEQLKTMEIARTQMIELSKRYPRDLSGLSRLALIDDMLVGPLVRRERPSEARAISEEALESRDAYLALSPGDAENLEKRFGCARWIVGSLTGADNDLLYDQWNARAIMMLQDLKGSRDLLVGGVFKLSRSRRIHADDLMFRGESDHARKELEQDLALIRSLPAEETTLPEYGLTESLTLAALGRWSGEVTLPRSQARPRVSLVPIDALELDLAELTARRIGWLPSIARSSWLIPVDLPMEAWTDRVISSIQADAARSDLDRTRVPAIAWMTQHHFAGVMTRQRAAGRLGDAHRIADQVVALAARLSREYPDQAAPRMLLSEGYAQIAKIAYREDQAPGIKAWEQKALSAAIQALTLEPGKDEAHDLVKDRKNRLDKIAENKPGA